LKNHRPQQRKRREIWSFFMNFVEDFVEEDAEGLVFLVEFFD